MATQYGVTVTNKFALAILDDEEDPFEVLNHQEELKKQQEEKEKATKGKTTGKNKQAKKSVPQENKNKPQEPVAQKKEEKSVNQSQSRPFSQGERPPRAARQNRDSRGDDGDRRSLRRRDENAPSENRFGERSEGGNRPDSGFSERGRGGFGRGRGGRGRGERGGRGGGAPRGGFGEMRGKREFDRHSGSDRTSGVKATDKRDGGGAHNWGSVKDDLEEEIKVATEETENKPEWSAENNENQDPNESTESTENAEEDAASKQMTLAEWKAEQDKNRMKSSFNIRKAGEGVDDKQWKKGVVYKKPEVEDDDEEDEDEEDDDEDDEHKGKNLLTDIKITFNDSPRRGRGGRRPRGGRGGRGNSGIGRGDRRGNSNYAPKLEDEEAFPSLVKTSA